MILATLSDNVQLAIVGIVGLLIKEYFDYCRGQKAAAGIEQIHKATNSMKDQLVEEVRKASEAKGLAQGLAQKPKPTE